MTNGCQSGMRLIALSMVAAALAFIGTIRSAHAHHSFAAVFDADAPIESTGIVTDVEWMNPHVWIYVDVIDSEGATENWAFELGSTTGLRRNGWSRDTVQAGHEIKISGYQARDGSQRANVRAITLADGSEITGNSSRFD